MIRNTSSLGDILDAEYPDMHLCKSGYSEDNILAESETVECDLSVSLLPRDCQTRFNLATAAAAEKFVSTRREENLEHHTNLASKILTSRN